MRPRSGGVTKPRRPAATRSSSGEAGGGGSTENTRCRRAASELACCALHETDDQVCTWVLVGWESRAAMTVLLRHVLYTCVSDRRRKAAIAIFSLTLKIVGDPCKAQERMSQASQMS